MGGSPFGAWVGLLFDDYSAYPLAWSIDFDEPSATGVMAVAPDCVRRWNRLPEIVVVDLGPEFQNVYLDTLLARARVSKMSRPASEPRYGAPEERMFGTAQVQLVHQLRGHTRALQNVRMVSREVNPQALAVWTMPDFRGAVEDYLYQHYVKSPHPGLNGMSPETALSESVALSGERRHRRIAYDDTFRILTLPSPPRPAVKITPPGKIRVLHLDYWCPEFRDRALWGTRVNVRYDPDDRCHVEAWVKGQWRECTSEHHRIFKGRSQREIEVAAKIFAREQGVVRNRRTGPSGYRLAAILELAHEYEALRLAQLKQAEKRRSGSAWRQLRAGDHPTPVAADLTAAPPTNRCQPPSATRHPVPGRPDTPPPGLRPLGRAMSGESMQPLFPAELLAAPIRERVDFFRSRFVAHERLAQVAEDMKRAILCPADCAILFVVGPTGVGKSTCRRLVQKLLRNELQAELERDRSRLPYLAVEAPESGGQFNWSDFDKRLLITAEEPFVDSKISYGRDILVRRPDNGIEVRARVVRGDLRLCVEEVLQNRRPAALMVDEAAHIFNVAGGQAYRKQLDALKSLANLGGTVIVLPGAYDLLSTLGPQLTRRRELVHFQRYRREVSREREEFLTVLGNFQWSLPLPTVPDLMAHAEFLYYACSGCVGVLHGWLTKALVTACHRRLTTISASC